MSMNETKYNFEFWRWNFPCDNFKKRQALIIINTIGGSRLCMDMAFESYGHIAFSPEDTCNRYPEITYLEDFNRVKANCLIYNLKNTAKNQGKYDKCFIYHSAGTNGGNYGYVFYNTDTKIAPSAVNVPIIGPILAISISLKFEFSSIIDFIS